MVEFKNLFSLVFIPLRKRTMFEQTFKNIDDVLWKEAGCTTELDYTEQTSWMLFLKYLDCKTRSNNGPQKRLHIAVVAE